MKRTLVYFTILSALGLVAGGCSSEDNEAEEHVWKDQVEAIDKARQVENLLKDAAGKQKEATQDPSY